MGVVVALEPRPKPSCGTCLFWGHAWFEAPFGCCTAEAGDKPDAERKTFEDHRCDRHERAS